MFILTQDNERIINLDSCDVVFADKKNRVIAGLANTSNIAILGIQLTPEEEANFPTHSINAKTEPHTWHCLDIPFMIMCYEQETAEKIRDIINNHIEEIKGTVQIGWEN